MFDHNAEGSVSNSDSVPLKLVLDDGKSFDGFSFGHKPSSPIVGEVVFNTGMVGYTEAMTDPSYSGQLLCFTYPLLGNYGVPEYSKDTNGILRNFESSKIQTKGIIASQATRNPSHYDMKKTIGAWMDDEGISGIEGLDTRELTIHLRERGVMMGAFAEKIDDARKALLDSPDYSSINFTETVSTKSQLLFGKPVNGRIAVIDCGVKLNIIRNLVKRGFEVTVLPYSTKIDELGTAYDGIVISNGPGDPKNSVDAIALTRSAIANGTPILGICLGTQIVALALGADTYKLKYGHRGQNKPCIDLKTGKCLVTSQNHGYTVREDSLQGTGLEPWFVNADDKTIEGLMHTTKPCISVQFHPEASPGPVDTSYVFDIFYDKILKSS
ncbi:MAG: glutamine-hydrolyzing carbamoyl-phosphate synthase small subunit [Thaumarchaeota archaeon]|nr:glutamine-hydrolyzing carbamoyl-phosphate synthase small subunit [Nitrososphaerota archaeon]